MRKNLTKKLFLSVLTLAFAVVSLGASTYAWFTLSSNAKVETFEGTVTGGAGLEIQVLSSDATATDANAWQTTVIESTLIKNVINDVTLDARTLKEAGTTSMFAALDGTTEKTDGFIKFDLAFRLSDQSESRSFDLYLDGYTLQTAGTYDDPKTEGVDESEVGVDAWRVNREYTGKNGTYLLNSEKTYWVSDAARLGIVSKDKGSATEAIANKYFQAPSGSDEYTAGIPGKGNSDVNAAVNYYNAVNPTATINPANAPQYTADSAVGAQTAGYKIGTLTGAEEVRITVYVWVEGWDAECINAIFEQTLHATLNFYLNIPQA